LIYRPRTNSFLAPQVQSENFPEALYILTDVDAAMSDPNAYEFDLSSGRSRHFLVLPRQLKHKPTMTEREVAAVSILSQLKFEEGRSEWCIANLASQWKIVLATFGQGAFSHSSADSYITAAPSISCTAKAMANHNPLADLAVRCQTPAGQNTPPSTTPAASILHQPPYQLLCQPANLRGTTRPILDLR
jgi:hypothetical protein